MSDHEALMQRVRSAHVEAHRTDPHRIVWRDIRETKSGTMIVRSRDPAWSMRIWAYLTGEQPSWRWQAKELLRRWAEKL